MLLMTGDVTFELVLREMSRTLRLGRAHVPDKDHVTRSLATVASRQGDAIRSSCRAVHRVLGAVHCVASDATGVFLGDMETPHLLRPHRCDQHAYLGTTERQMVVSVASIRSPRTPLGTHTSIPDVSHLYSVLRGCGLGRPRPLADLRRRFGRGGGVLVGGGSVGRATGRLAGGTPERAPLRTGP
jgi:hypothetical protein